MFRAPGLGGNEKVKGPARAQGILKRSYHSVSRPNLGQPRRIANKLGPCPRSANPLFDPVIKSEVGTERTESNSQRENGLKEMKKQLKAAAREQARGFPRLRGPEQRRSVVARRACPRQCKILSWARASGGASSGDVVRAEAAEDVSGIYTYTLREIQAALEHAGIAFGVQTGFRHTGCGVHDDARSASEQEENAMTTSQAAIVVGALSAFSMAAHAWTPEELKQEIIDRCQAQMAEYGASIVKACVDQESEAANALGRYP